MLNAQTYQDQYNLGLTFVPISTSCDDSSKLHIHWEGMCFELTYKPPNLQYSMGLATIRKEGLNVHIVGLIKPPAITRVISAMHSILRMEHRFYNEHKERLLKELKHFEEKTLSQDGMPIYFDPKLQDLSTTYNQPASLQANVFKLAVGNINGEGDTPATPFYKWMDNGLGVYQCTVPCMMVVERGDHWAWRAYHNKQEITGTATHQADAQMRAEQAMLEMIYEPT